MPLTTGVRAVISGPTDNSVVSGVTPILGNAQFDSSEIQFYKIEYRGMADGSWITIGETHATPKSGVLETWYAEALPSGVYQVRLVLVKRDGNFLVPSLITVQVQR